MAPNKSAAAAHPLPHTKGTTSHTAKMATAARTALKGTATLKAGPTAGGPVGEPVTKARHRAAVARAKRGAAPAPGDEFVDLHGEEPDEETNAVAGEFPKRVYHPKGQERTVVDKADQQKWQKAGFVESPPKDEPSIHHDDAPRHAPARKTVARKSSAATTTAATAAPHPK